MTGTELILVKLRGIITQTHILSHCAKQLGDKAIITTKIHSLHMKSHTFQVTQVSVKKQ